MTQQALSALQGEVVVDPNRSLIGVDDDTKRFVTLTIDPDQFNDKATCNALASVSVVKIHKGCQYRPFILSGKGPAL